MRQRYGLALEGNLHPRQAFFVNQGHFADCARQRLLNRIGDAVVDHLLRCRHAIGYGRPTAVRPIRPRPSVGLKFEAIPVLQHYLGVHRSDLATNASLFHLLGPVARTNNIKNRIAPNIIHGLLTAG